MGVPLWLRKPVPHHISWTKQYPILARFRVLCHNCAVYHISHKTSFGALNVSHFQILFSKDFRGCWFFTCPSSLAALPLGCNPHFCCSSIPMTQLFRASISIIKTAEDKFYWWNMWNMLILTANQLQILCEELLGLNFSISSSTLPLSMLLKRSWWSPPLHCFQPFRFGFVWWNPGPGFKVPMVYHHLSYQNLAICRPYRYIGISYPICSPQQPPFATATRCLSLCLRGKLHGSFPRLWLVSDRVSQRGCLIIG